jgi:hypothetical protein
MYDCKAMKCYLVFVLDLPRTPEYTAENILGKQGLHAALSGGHS